MNNYGIKHNNSGALILKKWILDNVQGANESNYKSYPWCAVAMIEAIKSTNYQGAIPNAWVDTWLNFGTSIDKNKAEMGDIIIIGSTDYRTHITTFVRYSTDFKYAYCLGGNQGSTIQVQIFDLRDVYSIRRVNNL